MALLSFDAVELNGRSVIREPWEHRLKRLEDLFAAVNLPRVSIVLVADDAARLYETWVGMGGEGIVLKDLASVYRPGTRSPAWLKVKPKLTLEVVVAGGSPTPIPWGDWGMAVMLELRLPAPENGPAGGDPAGRPNQARRSLRVEGWRTRGGALLGRDAERDAAASAVRPVAGRSEERHTTSAEGNPTPAE